jgi:hypothetical protein
MSWICAEMLQNPAFPQIMCGRERAGNAKMQAGQGRPYERTALNDRMAGFHQFMRGLYT